MTFNDYKDLREVEGTEKDIKKFKRNMFLKYGAIVFYLFSNIILIIITGKYDLKTSIIYCIVFGGLIIACIPYAKYKTKIYRNMDQITTAENIHEIEKKLNRLAKKHNRLYARGYNRAFHDVMVYHGGNSLYGNYANSFWITLAISKRLFRFQARMKANSTLTEMKAFQYKIKNNPVLSSYFYGFGK